MCPPFLIDSATPVLKVKQLDLKKLSKDLLEIRLRELDEVVDKFLILESDRTFTGKFKPWILQKHITGKTTLN